MGFPFLLILLICVITVLHSFVIPPHPLISIYRLKSTENDNPPSSLPPPQVASSSPPPPPPPQVACPDCDQCDGSGRIAGGLATIPLFSFWPIKAYRPCPNFTKRGGIYLKSGQSLDEIAFGRQEGYIKKEEGE